MPTLPPLGEVNVKNKNEDTHLSEQDEAPPVHKTMAVPISPFVVRRYKLTVTAGVMLD